jgi:hypothetical protein
MEYEKDLIAFVRYQTYLQQFIDYYQKRIDIIEKMPDGRIKNISEETYKDINHQANYCVQLRKHNESNKKYVKILGKLSILERKALKEYILNNI